VRWMMFFKDTPEVTEDELTYFREHPDEIDDVSTPLNIHKFFLVLGIVLGALLTLASKLLGNMDLESYLGPVYEPFVVDMIYESGVALVSAAITAFLLGVLLNSQQRNAKIWRRRIRTKLRETSPSNPPSGQSGV